MKEHVPKQIDFDANGRAVPEGSSEMATVIPEPLVNVGKACKAVDSCPLV
jgi:hypothetical protein